MSTSPDSQLLLPAPETCEDKIRRNPLAAVGYAGLIGYLIYLLPIGAILRLLIRLAIFAISPALVVLGVIKSFELMRPLVSARKDGPAVTDNSEPLLDSPPGPSQEDVLPR